jgi:hypothetical protein
MPKYGFITFIAIALSVCVHASSSATTLEGKLVSASCYLPDRSQTGNEMQRNQRHHQVTGELQKAIERHDLGYMEAATALAFHVLIRIST